MIKKVVGLKPLKDLLKNHKWVHGTFGELESPKVSKDATIAIQEVVDQFAREVAVEANLIIRDDEEHWRGDRRMNSKHASTIQRKDVEQAAKNILSGKKVKIQVVMPKPCIVCGKEFDHLAHTIHGLLCPHCNHVVDSSCLAYKEGDAVPVELCGK